MNNQGNIPVQTSPSDQTSGMRGQSDNMNASNMGSNPHSRNAAEALRDSTYGHSSSREDDIRSGWGGHSINSDNYGRETNAQLDGTRMGQSSDRTGLGNHPVSGTQGSHASNVPDTMGNTSAMGDTGRHHSMGTGTDHHAGGLGDMGSPMNPTTDHHHGHDAGYHDLSQQLSSDTKGSSNPSHMYTTATGINSGQGVHAQQYSGRGSGTEGGTTTFMSQSDDQHHHHGHSEHGHPKGQGKQHGCSKCIGSAIPDGTNQSKMTTAIANSNTTKEGPSNLNLRPGETVVEHETTVHKGGMAYGSGEHTSSGGQNKTGHHTGMGTASTGNTGRGVEEPHGKATMSDKIIGEAAKITGKMTSNTGMVERGEARAAGDFERYKN